MKQLAGPIPQDLYPDAYQEKGRELEGYVHPGWPDHCSQPVSERLTEIITRGDKSQTNGRCHNGQQTSAKLVRSIRTQSDCNRD